MEQSVHSDNQFVVDLLTTLREERFSPRGWWRFFARSWAMSYATARANPSLKRSWLRMTLLIILFAAAMLFVTFVFEGTAALRLLSGLAFCVVWQQSDLFWHLGLNRHARTGALLWKIGLASTLSGLRGLCASYLLARLLGGLATSPELALSVFLAGITSDILDGQVARLTDTQSRLGQIIDGETDFCLYLAMTIILIQDHILALWIGIAMLLRFVVPLLAALVSYFLFARPVSFGSTIWGKYAGLAQCLYILLLLAPARLASIAHVIDLPLLLVMLGLLIAAPLAQIIANRPAYPG
jgi:phosphatidylglycerophosphate synthase